MRRPPPPPMSAAMAMMVDEWEANGPAVGEWMTRDETIRPPRWFGLPIVPAPDWEAEEAERRDASLRLAPVADG